MLLLRPLAVAETGGQSGVGRKRKPQRCSGRRVSDLAPEQGTGEH